LFNSMQTRVQQYLLDIHDFIRDTLAVSGSQRKIVTLAATREVNHDIALVQMDEAMSEHQGQRVFETILLEFLGMSENGTPISPRHFVTMASKVLLHAKFSRGGLLFGRYPIYQLIYVI
jgi:hypothetical protein